MLSHNTFSRLFRLLGPEASGRVFATFLDDPGADGSGVVAIDGKILRRSFDRAAERSPLHVVTAFGAGARALLETLCLEGVLVTADALQTQTGTAALILAKGGDYLFALKANHPMMAREVAEYFAVPADKMMVYQIVDADHGRIETRRHRVSHHVDCPSRKSRLQRMCRWLRSPPMRSSCPRTSYCR